MKVPSKMSGHHVVPGKIPGGGQAGCYFRDIGYALTLGGIECRNGFLQFRFVVTESTLQTEVFRKQCIEFQFKPFTAGLPAVFKDRESTIKIKNTGLDVIPVDMKQGHIQSQPFIGQPASGTDFIVSQAVGIENGARATNVSSGRRIELPRTETFRYQTIDHDLIGNVP